MDDGGVDEGGGVIGVTTSPCALKRGAIAIGLAARTRCACSSSTISAAESAAAAASSTVRISARLCRVPPEMMSEALTAAVGERQVGVEVGDGELLAPALARGLGGEQDEEVGRHRLEAARVDDLHARLLGALAGELDHPAHEGDLAGQVHVVGAAGDAGLDHRLAVEGVGADHVEHDVSRARPSPPARRRPRRRRRSSPARSRRARRARARSSPGRVPPPPT